MLSPQPFPSQNWCYRTAVLSVANSDNKQGRFDSAKFSERCPPEFPKGLLQKWCCPTAVASIANTDNKQGRSDSINFSEGCRFRRLGAIEPLRFQKLRLSKGGSIAPNFIQGASKLYMGYHIHGVFYKVLYKVFYSAVYWVFYRAFHTILRKVFFRV